MPVLLLLTILLSETVFDKKSSIGVLYPTWASIGAPNLGLKSSHVFNSVFNNESKAWIEGGRASTALTVEALLSEMAGVTAEAGGAVMAPAGPTSKPAEADAMSSRREVAASNLRMNCVSTVS